MMPASQGLGDTSSEVFVYLGFILRLFAVVAPKSAATAI
jgi:hypothetical protein